MRNRAKGMLKKTKNTEDMLEAEIFDQWLKNIITKRVETKI